MDCKNTLQPLFKKVQPNFTVESHAGVQVPVHVLADRDLGLPQLLRPRHRAPQTTALA